jgi:hypothetical protein
MLCVPAVCGCFLPFPDLLPLRLPSSYAGVIDLAAAFNALAEDVRGMRTDIQALPAHIVEATAEAEFASFRSDPGYETYVRNALPRALLYRCGLEVPQCVNEFHRQDLGVIEWDFRCPVLIAAAPAAGAAAAPEEFVIFADKANYTRPAPLPSRLVTPTKYGAAAPPSAHYLAIMEITTAAQWTRPTSSRPGLLERLEVRLRTTGTLERARSDPTLGLSHVTSITDLVAVVGVVAPAPYSTSVRQRLANAVGDELGRLREMTAAGRFVFIRMELPGSPTASGGDGGSGRWAATGDA